MQRPLSRTSPTSEKIIGDTSFKVCRFHQHGARGFRRGAAERPLEKLPSHHAVDTI